MSYRHQATDIITVTWILYHSDCRENHLFGDVTLGHKTKMVYDDSTSDTSNYCLFENPLNSQCLKIIKKIAFYIASEAS